MPDEPSANGIEFIKSAVAPMATVDGSHAGSRIGTSTTTTLASGIGVGRVLLSLVMVALADAAIYRTNGYSGLALFFLVAPWILILGINPRGGHRTTWLIAAMQFVLAAKLIWLGNPLLTLCGMGMMVVLAATLHGMPPFLLESIRYLAVSVKDGALAILGALSRGSQANRSGNIPWLNLLMPMLAIFVFGAIFVLANPNLSSLSVRWLKDGAEWLAEWLRYVSVFEMLFWAWVFWITISVLRPTTWISAQLVEPRQDVDEQTIESPSYGAFRNTLLSVIGLFAVYLVFEFQTLWFREFPDGFYYAGYAHEGAAWLTIALALSTILLSGIFHGSTLRDPRIDSLKRLAWIWSALNLVLAVAVYNRLLIYVGFNGLTPMRMVGFFGMTAVVVGFLLVLVKIARSHSFLWLFRRQLITLAVTVYAFAITPIDLIVVRYNVDRILAGHLAPAVQISVQSIDTQGVAHLTPLLQCNDDKIRNGVAAFLSEEAEELARLEAERSKQDWTTFQWSDRIASAKLRSHRNTWQAYDQDETLRRKTLDEFTQYVQQWY